MNLLPLIFAAWVAAGGFAVIYLDNWTRSSGTMLDYLAGQIEESGRENGRLAARYDNIEATTFKTRQALQALQKAHDAHIAEVQAIRRQNEEAAQQARKRLRRR